jgi:cytochrome c oxidase subunit 1
MATTTLDGQTAEPSFYTAKRGIKNWLYTVDHKRIGIMYLVGVLLAFLAAGILAILVRIELMTPAIDFLVPAAEEGVDLGKLQIQGRELYNKIFTLHGGLMVFVFIIPSVPAALGNFLLPLMLGAKDVAFPRLNLLSFYIWIAGTSILLVAILNGGLDTGWTFYTPYSTGESGTAVITATTGAFVLGFSSILTGLNFVVTVHKMRAPGMTWNRMPLFVWAIYATAAIQILATPVLAITLLLLIIERTLEVGIFNPEMGGDPVLFQHFFWFYSHPAVYIMILPGFGIISELLTVHSKKRIFGYKAIALSSVSIALISFMVWGHHMFVSGQSLFSSILFSFLTMFVAVPTAIKVFSWTATLYGGSISFTTPMLYGMIFLFTFTIGGLTGIFLGALSTDVHLHDSYFVVAHFHYVMMGGTVIAFLGGLHHWWPKMTGRMYHENAARFGAALVFFGFNLLFFTQFFLGTKGMPRRYSQYDFACADPQICTASELAQKELWESLHTWSSIGSFILAAGLFLHLFIFLTSLKTGKKAGPNPWGGVSLEWATSSPPIEHNFHETPHVDKGPYEFPEIDESQSAAH